VPAENEDLSINVEDLPSSETPLRPPQSYDELVRVSAQGSIFAYRWWLEAVAPGKHEVLEIRTDQGLLAAWPLVFRDTDEGAYVSMPALTQKLGILFAPSDRKPVEIQSDNQKLAARFIEKLAPRIAGFHQNFHENFTDWLPFCWTGHAQTTRYTYVLEDISDTDAVWAGLRANHRRDIHRAERLGVRIVDDLALEEFLDLYHRTFARQGLRPLTDDDTVRRLDAACQANAGQKIFAGIGPDGKVHAAVYIVWADDTAYYLMGGSEPDMRESGAQLLALMEAIRFTSTVAKRFDFEGSMLPRVERVFRGFGAAQRPYFAISKVPQAPSTLSGYIKASMRVRLMRARKAILGRLNGRPHADRNLLGLFYLPCPTQTGDLE
jgi:hypothetical protein